VYKGIGKNQLQPSNKKFLPLVPVLYWLVIVVGMQQLLFSVRRSCNKRKTCIGIK
jgi:hypothetical protein